MNQRLKVAIADDDPDTREYLQAYLSRLGHEVAAAADGRDLVEVCRAFGPDVVVTDYAMPGLDGVAAAAEVNRSRRVPVVLISGGTDLGHPAGWGRGPIAASLPKPTRETELRVAVDAAAGGGGPAGYDRGRQVGGAIPTGRG